MPLTAQWLRRVPKVELHVHLEGTLSPDRIAALAAGRPDAGRGPRPDWTTLTEFLRYLDWSAGLVSSEDAARAVAFDCAARLHADGTAYAEVIVNPGHWRAISPTALLGAVHDGFERAAAAGLADCRILLSVSRSDSPDSARRLLDRVLVRRPARLLGLSIDGDESASPKTGPRFAPLFADARAGGLGVTAHAGESSGPDGVAEAIDHLGVNRIDHGVRAAEDSRLLARLARDRITLNICPTSNIRLGLYPDYARHPLALIWQAGVRATVNTDDPELFGVSLTEEFRRVAMACRWQPTDIVAATRHAIDAAFCDSATKSRLRRDLDRLHDVSPPSR